MSWQKFDKYKPAFDYIIENKPKHIVEYGGGQSTYFINQLLDELDYGGKVTAYEDNPKFFNYSVEQGWNINNSIKLVDTEIIDQELGILRYVHSLDEIVDVDFIILDGPDYREFLDNQGHPFNVTDNIEVIFNGLNKTIPFWIEGRLGSQSYCKQLKYKMITEYEV